MMAAPRGYTIDEDRKQHLLSLMEEGKRTGKKMPCCNKNCVLESDSVAPIRTHQHKHQYSQHLILRIASNTKPAGPLLIGFAVTDDIYTNVTGSGCSLDPYPI